MSTALKEFILQQLNDYNSHKDNAEYIENGFYYMYYDENEGPYSRGNDQDIYDDGFNAGYDQGRYDLLVELQKIIKE